MLIIVLLNDAMLLQVWTNLKLIKLAWSTYYWAPDNQVLGVRNDTRCTVLT